MDFYFLSSNKRKIDILKNVIKDTKVTFSVIDNIFIPEIQSNNTDEIAKFSVEYCSKELNYPVVKNDLWFFIESLNWFPWPYIRNINDVLWLNNFLKLLKNINSKNAYIKTSIAFCKPWEKAIIFSSLVYWEIITDPIDKNLSIIDNIFIPYNEKNKEGLTLWEIKKKNFDLYLQMWWNAEQLFIDSMITK